MEHSSKSLPRILLVEDDETVFRMLEALLPEDRVTLEWRATGEAGREAFYQRDYDLTILDYQLPDALGLELLDQFHGRKPAAPIILFTGYATVDVAVQAMKRGAMDFFTKPLEDPPAFLRFLNRTLRPNPPLPIPGVGRIPAPDEAVSSSLDFENPTALRARCAALDPPVELSGREEEVLLALLRGDANKQIAAALFISERTVKNHCTHIYRKFDVESRPQLFHRLMQG